jgi:hypothetical protein
MPTGCNGASTHLRELANALVARGASVTLLAPRARHAPGIDCDLVDIDTDPILPALRRLAAKEDPAGKRARTEASECTVC